MRTICSTTAVVIIGDKRQADAALCVLSRVRVGKHPNKGNHAGGDKQKREITTSIW
jgi:hypothetical protein